MRGVEEALADQCLLPVLLTACFLGLLLPVGTYSRRVRIGDMVESSNISLQRVQVGETALITLQCANHPRSHRVRSLCTSVQAVVMYHASMILSLTPCPSRGVR